MGRGSTLAAENARLQRALEARLEGDLHARLFPAHETALYFVAAEALTNVAKYARPNGAAVSLRRKDGWVEITATDDGVGGAQPEGRKGLRGLTDRIDALGGRLTVASAPSEGTTISARLPR